MRGNEGALRLRPGTEEDMPFLERMTPRLAAQGKLPWHEEKTILAFQRAYIAEALEEARRDGLYLVATDEAGQAVGLAIACAAVDEISGEPAGMLRILVVDEAQEGTGVAARLMEAVNAWAGGRGYRLMLLDVFAANDRAQEFYARRGFRPDFIRMISEI